MGLSWQQGPLGRNPSGTFVSATPMPERVLYLEPLRRRMSVELGGAHVSRIADLVSFYPETVTVTIDGEKLESVPGQDVVAHGPGRNLTLEEIGGIQLVEYASSAQARA